MQSEMINWHKTRPSGPRPCGRSLWPRLCTRSPCRSLWWLMTQPQIWNICYYWRLFVLESGSGEYFLFVKIQTLWNRSSVEMSDNAWLAAYEAQKAAVLKKIQQKSAPDSSSVSGTSKFSGLVDAKEVGHVVKSNQVTKLLNTLKTKEQSSPVATTVPKSTKPELLSVNRSQSTDKAFTPLTTHLPGPSISAEFQGQILKIILA